MDLAPPLQAGNLLGAPFMRATDILALQRSMGNQAVQRQLAQPGVAQISVVQREPAPSTKSGGGPPIQRLLWTSKQFKEATDAGVLTRRGKTLVQIENLLDEYHEMRKTASHLKPGPSQDRALNLLHELSEDTAIWLDTHEGDTSRSRHRRAGIIKLQEDVNAEILELSNIRAESQKFLGEAPTELTRTENKFKTQMEGSASSVLRRLGPILSAAVPRAGDTAEIEVEIKIPVDPNGVGYIGFRLKAEAERMLKKATKARFELAVTGGAQIGNVADIGGELGMYIEAQGATPAATMELLSYGMYRRFRESKLIPNEVANFIWGGSATSVGWKRAEKWAAMVEKENFKKKGTLAQGGGVDENESGAYVETGGLAGVSASGGVGGVAKLEGEASYSTGKHYDYDSVSKLKSAGLGKESKLPTRRLQTEVIGESVHALELSFSAEGGPFSGSVSVGFEWSTEERKGRAKLQSVEVSLSAGATLPMGELVGKGIGGAVAPLASRLSTAIREAAEKAKGEKKTRSSDVGELSTQAEDGALALSQLAGLPQEEFVPEFDLDSDPPTFEATAEVKITLTGGYEFGDDGGFKFEFKLEYVKGLEVNTGPVALTIKRGRRILRIGYEGGKWKVD